MDYKLRSTQAPNAVAKAKKSSAERTSKYREKLKADQDKCKEIKEKDRQRHAVFRDMQIKRTSTDNMLKEKIRKQRNEQMRRYREKKLTKKANDNALAKKAKKLGKKKKDAKLYLKEKVEKERKKREVKKTQLWRMKINLQSPASNIQQPDKDEGFGSYSTEYRACKRAVEALPKTPLKKAKIIEKMLTPETSAVLELKGFLKSSEERKTAEVGETVMMSLKQNIENLKPSGTGQKDTFKAYRMLKTVLSSTPICAKSKLRGTLNKYFNFKRGIPQSKSQNNQWWIEKGRKQRKDRIPEKTRNIVEHFNLSQEISREIPLKREAMKVKDENNTTIIVQKNVMVMTLQEAHGAFKIKYPNEKVGLSMCAYGITTLNIT